MPCYLVNFLQICWFISVLFNIKWVKQINARMSNLELTMMEINGKSKKQIFDYTNQTGRVTPHSLSDNC